MASSWRIRQAGYGGAVSDVRELSPAKLAYVGDAVQELDVRCRLVLTGGRLPELHRLAVRRVRAEAQAAALRQIEGFLTAEEQELLRRFRNSRQPSRSGLAPELRHLSQALEGLLGYWYLTGQDGRLREVLDLVWQAGG